jgi:glycosyltransferase involved in cell wall biosynthesis
MPSLTYLSTAAIPSTTANSIHVMKMCQAFCQEGYDATLLIPDFQRAPAPDPGELRHHYGITVPFRLQRFPSLRPLRGWDFDFKSLRHVRRMRTPLLYTRSLRQAALSSWAGIPTIFEAHDIPRGILGDRYFKHILSSEKILRIVSISEALKCVLLQSHGARASLERDILVQPDGVDIERFQPLPEPAAARSELGISERFTVGYSGHLYPGRGVDLILELAERLPDATFLLVGGTPEALRLWQEKARHRRNVIFKGFIPNGELPRYLAACDVLVMPYQAAVAVSSGGDTSRWMSPMKMFEYLAAGRLIVSSDLPVLREVLNERNSVLCSAQDADAWTRTLTRAREDADWRLGLEAQAKLDAQGYSWRNRVRQILQGVDL